MNVAPRIVTVTTTAAAAIALLAGCTLTATGPTATDTPTPTATHGAEGAIQYDHTPGIVVDDAWQSPNGCVEGGLDAAAGQYLPDPACTPGGIDPAVTQANIGTTICRRGYAASVRPPESATEPFKLAALKAYGIADSPAIEYDHLIPLELGGASDTANLWPELNATGATGPDNPKDLVENELNAAVCDHKITLAHAQTIIAETWIQAEELNGLPITTGSNKG